MHNVPIKLFFVGTYAEVLDQPGTSEHKVAFKKFGQQFTTHDIDLARRLVSIEPGSEHRVAHFVTEDEFRSIFLDDHDPKQPGYQDKVAVVQKMLFTPGVIEDVPAVQKEAEKTSEEIVETNA